VARGVSSSEHAWRVLLRALSISTNGRIARNSRVIMPPRPKVASSKALPSKVQSQRRQFPVPRVDNAQDGADAEEANVALERRFFA
jgi:hypothetical protein